MNQDLLLPWRLRQTFFLSPLHPLHLPSTLSISSTAKPTTNLLIRAATLQSSSIDEQTAILTAKEKRDLRNAKRDQNKGYSWREEVEQKLLKKPKKEFKSWKEELNLDKLSLLGPRWWILKVSRAKGKDTVVRMMQALHRNFPDGEFKVYAAAVDEKKKLKNGSISVKPKPLYPGCVFFHCTLDRELHNFIREECEGVGGFVGRMVGNTKKQINKPRPITDDDMEEIFQEVKEKQEAADKAFEQEHEGIHELEIVDKRLLSLSDQKLVAAKTKGRSRRPSGILLGSTVRIVSGVFTDFTGTVKKLDKKRGMATVKFTLFGKETLADLDLCEVVEDHK